MLSICDFGVRKVYISITGLKLLKPWKVFRFYWYAIPCLRAAKRTPGNILAKEKSINGIRHTLTVWENKRAMQDFAFHGVHLEAIKAFNKIAEGKTYGYEADVIPDWDEVRITWQTKGKVYKRNIANKWPSGS